MAKISVAALKNRRFHLNQMIGLSWVNGRYAPPLFIGVLFVAAVAFYWSGIGPGDAERYIGPALRWADGGVFLGETHWSLRLPLVLPIAAAFKLFGVSEFSATLPNVVYAAGLVTISFWFGRRYLGEIEGLASAAFIAVSAYFVARPLEIDVYGAEVFFAALSAWLFVAAEFEKRRFALLVGCGAAAGFAVAIREQTVYLIGAYGLLTLIGRKDVVRSGLALCTGFGLVIFSEMLFYALAVGDPIYRYRIDLGHRTIGQNVEFKGDDAALSAKLFRPVVDVFSYAAMTPFLLIVAATAWKPGWRIGMEPRARRRALRIFWLLSAIAVPVCAYVFELSFARYYPILAYAAFLTLGVAAAAIWRTYGGIAGAVFFASVVFLNAAAADFSKYHEYAEVRALADLAEISDETIKTDLMTAFRARYQLVLRGVDFDDAARMVVGDQNPAEGELFFKSYATPQIHPTWCVLKVIDARPKNWTHSFLRVLRVDKVMGGRASEIIAPPAAVELARVLESSALNDPVTGAPCVNRSDE